MKRLLVAVGILLALFSLTLWNSNHLRVYSVELINLLVRAEGYTVQEDWGLAGVLTAQAQEKWDRKENYLRITLRHGDTNEIYAGFREVRALLTARDRAAYAAASARLVANIRLLYQMEQVNLKNIL